MNVAAAPARVQQGRLSLAAQALLVASMAWGAFAFGAVYPWGYWPLATAALTIALIGLFTRASSGRTWFEAHALSLALAAFAFAIVLQLIPVAPRVSAALSPSAADVLAQLDPRVRIGLVSRHPLSLAPAATLTGLALFVSFALLVTGASRLMTVAGAYTTARAVAILGALLALTGIVQQPLFSGRIYGFWTPEMGGLPYGPFVNKNHFAGWMLMGLPLTLGLLCGAVARGMRGVNAGLRERILWLSSPDASHIVLLAGAAAVMALSLILTMSRSGMAAAAVAVIITMALAFVRQRTLPRKIAGAVLVAVIMMVVVGSVGLGAISDRFQSANWREINDRKGAWEDAIAIARRYPLVGTGFNTYGVATLFYQRYDLAQHYAQAHNDYLQLAAEGGVLLIVPAIACVGLFGIAVRRRFREEPSTTTYWIRAGAVTGLLAIALQETVEFSLQMPGNALLFAVLCAIALHRTPRHRLV
jgi:O-antigen ligase